MRKHEKSRYDLIATTFERVGVRLYRLPDTDFGQKPADQIGFVLGKEPDRGRMVMVETKEVIKMSECEVFTLALFNKLSDNQKLTLSLAAPNGCYCFVAIYCQEDRKLHLWKVPHVGNPFIKMANTPPDLVLEKRNGEVIHPHPGKEYTRPYFDLTNEQFATFRNVWE